MDLEQADIGLRRLIGAIVPAVSLISLVSAVKGTLFTGMGFSAYVFMLTMWCFWGGHLPDDGYRCHVAKDEARALDGAIGRRAWATR